MRVLLIRMNSVADEIIPPISLGYLAQTIIDRHEVVIVDCLRDGLGPGDIAKMAPAFDVAGITLFTKDLALCRTYLQSLKKGNPAIVTLVGGPHPSAVPEETARLFGALCDYVFAGESETSFPTFISCLSKGDVDVQAIPGLCVFRNGTTMMAPPVCPSEIDSFSVAWDLIAPDKYPEAPHGAFYRNFPIAPIITSRGCPFHCTFCGGHIISGRAIRQRSVGNVIDEISLLYHKFGVREIHIEDDNFTFRKAYVLEFCKSVAERFPDISWTCPNGVRIDTLDEEMLAAMKASGCYALSLGIESGNNDTLKAMKKSLTVEKTNEKIGTIARSGIDVNAFFILGYPGETKEYVEQTIRYALTLPLKRASFANFQPLPGTEAYHALIESGQLTIEHWEQFNPSLQSTVWSPPGFTTDELAAFRRRALLRFYLRPRIVIDFIRGINSWRHMRYVLKRAFRWLTFTGRKMQNQPVTGDRSIRQP